MEFRQLALRVLAAHAGATTGGETLAAVAQRAYDDLVHVCSPLIGEAGVHALTARALHLAQQDYSWLVGVRGPEHAKEPLGPVLASLAGQESAVAIEGAAAVFAMLVGLLATFVGEPLTASLIRRAWPEAYSDAQTEEM